MQFNPMRAGILKKLLGGLLFLPLVALATQPPDRRPASNRYTLVGGRRHCRAWANRCCWCPAVLRRTITA